MDGDLSTTHLLHGMRLVNRRTGEHTGACPHCQAGTNRYHVWTKPGTDGRPAWRYWCRCCGVSGVIGVPSHDQAPASVRPLTALSPAANPCAAHIPFYRQLYELTALWAHGWLLDAANPEPLASLAKRGVSQATAIHHLLGYALDDPQSLVRYLSDWAPDLMPYTQEAGLLVVDRQGILRTHWNLCGALLFPTIAEGEITDLRARKLGVGAKARSLACSPRERGAIYPFGWDEIGDADTVMLTESGEFKTLVPLAAYQAGDLSIPTIGCPGINGMPATLGRALLAKGVRCVIIGYDSQPRSVSNGTIQLAPEELWTLKHGTLLLDAGLEVRVLRLPLSRADLAKPHPKSDLDDFCLHNGPHRLQQLIDDAPLLNDYYQSLPRSLCDAARIPPPSAYPTRRARPQRISSPAPAAAPTSRLTLDRARADIRMQVAHHAQQHGGMLVLAHPPGTGKGFNTIEGLKDYLRADPDPGFIVWTSLRKAQIADQQGLQFIPLHGRHAGNCWKLPEALELGRKGYPIRDVLCTRRCPHAARCAYLNQFNQEGDFFAAMPLLQATHWWRDAGVVVLDEFDPSQLTRMIQLTSADLAAMARASCCPHAKAVVRWLAQVLAATTERTLTGSLLYQELDAAADAEGLSFAATLRLAVDALPATDTQPGLSQLPTNATLADYQALPPGYLPTLLRLLDREQRKRLIGQRFTSRVEARNGYLLLYLRLDHVIEQLAYPDQPKIILDGTANRALLEAIFPHTPIRVEQPRLAGASRVIQVIGQDWAKTTLQGQRLERWYDAIAERIRPDRPTLVVTTLEWEDNVRLALAQRGYSPDLVRVDHYGGLRGSNAYKGFDVVLAQVYNPNLEQTIRTARALFADDPTPLDERIILEERTLTDATGASWRIQVPTAADPRIAALLHAHREAEMEQAALRGRPLEHPEAQITILASLPLPGLPPTIICAAASSPQSNPGRERAMGDRLLAATQQLLDDGKRVLDAPTIARSAGVSVVTVRKHWEAIASRLHLRAVKQRATYLMPRGGQRIQLRAVLLRRGRQVPPATHSSAASEHAVRLPSAPMLDQARNMESVTRLICHSLASRRIRLPYRRTRHRRRRHQPPARAPG
jgi:hypothetical protein